MPKKLVWFLIVSAVLDSTDAQCTPKRINEYHFFPSGFKWSVATSAFQIEGATREGGRGPSIWDEYQKKPGKIRDGSTADIACDSYHKFRDDIELMKLLGVSTYRFSFSWSRLFPRGDITNPNQEGIKHYHELIDALITNNIEPMVTLYHWDLPLALQDAGGWLNRDIIEWFRLYATFCFWEFGDKVKLWVTIDEPLSQAAFGHCGFLFKIAPDGFQQHCHWAQYLAGHHMLLAHAHAYRAYHGLFPNSGGKVGIANQMTWVEPLTEFERSFAEEVREWTIGWFLYPLFKGEYPKAVRQSVDDNSIAEGRTVSRLPHFSKHEKEIMKGSFDFVGVNYFNTAFVRRFKKGEKDVHKAIGYDIDGILLPNLSDMPVGDKMSWMRSHPAGLRAILNYIRHNYNSPEIFITTNGCMDTPGESLRDITRIRYLREHLAALSQAIVDGCKVFGYAVWSLLDNFEWSSGYLRLFGLYKVDFNSTNRLRTPKLSARFYSDVIRNNSVVLIEDCTWNR